MTQKITRHKPRMSLPLSSETLNLGTWGRFYTWPAPQNFKMPRFPRRGGGGRFDKACFHCLKPFKTNRREQRFCKDGCRTYDFRLKGDEIVRYLMSEGMPFDTASDLLELSGIAVLSRKMETMGFVWDGQSWGKK